MKIKRSFSIIAEYFGRNDLRQLVANFFHYSSYQMITYIAQLIMIPYIVRVIGAANFGIINFALAFNSYLVIVTEFGFSISGVQYIAQAQNDIDKRREIISNILVLQVLLMIASFFVMFIIVNSFQKLQAHKEIFYFTFLIIPATVTTTVWFYLGMEKIKFLNFLNLISKSMYVIGIFVFVSNPLDYFYVPLIAGLSALTVGLISLYFLFFKFGAYPLSLKSINIVQSIKDNWNIFVSILAINLYRNTNILIIGFMAAASIVGIYSAGEKIVIFIQSIFAPITQVIYPYISRLKTSDPEKSKKLLIAFGLIIGVGTLLVSLILLIFSKQIAIIALGSKMIESGSIIRIASFVVFFGTLNFVLGIIFMTNYGMKSEFTKAVLITGLSNIIICITLSWIWQEIGTAIAFLSAEVILTLLLLYFINTKYKDFYQVIMFNFKLFSRTGLGRTFWREKSILSVYQNLNSRDVAHGNQLI